MRELLAKIEEKQTAAKGFLEANDTEKAQGCMTEIADLQAQYEIAEKLFKGRAEQGSLMASQTKRKTLPKNPTLRLLLAMSARWLAKAPLRRTSQWGITARSSLAPLQTVSSIRLRKSAPFLRA